MIRILDSNLSQPACRPDLLLEFTNEVFKHGGLLEKSLGFEYRSEQEEMAKSFARCLLDGRKLVCEAGTGVGKSLAYLVPAVLFARLTERPCVVATNTISLQEQLLEKDVPAVRKLLLSDSRLREFSEFDCAMLLGRANYLCSNRLMRALKTQSDLFEPRQRAELNRILEWADSSPLEGIRQELNPLPISNVWDLLNADSSLCSSHRCSPGECHYQRARMQVDRADLIVVNHSLLFSLLNLGSSANDDSEGILFHNDFLVFDEAHEIAEVADDHFGVSVSSSAMETFIRQVFNPAKGKGLIAKLGSSGDFRIVENALLCMNDFFQFVHLKILGDKDRVRLTGAGNLPAETFPALSRLIRLLIELSEKACEEGLKLELRDQCKRGQRYLNELVDFVERRDQSSVYWIERGGRNNSIIYLRSAHLKVAEVLQDRLFKANKSMLLTSATLSKNGLFADYAKRVGIEGADECMVRSPFDYERNLSIVVFSDCPDPKGEDRSAYLDYLVEAIFRQARSHEGGTLALFTNFSDLRFCYQRLRSKWKKSFRSLYAQGEGFSRSQLRRRMIEEGDVLLLGAESFWKGFDAKGSCLSQVIVTRLPFESPGHPLFQARSEALESQSKSSFMEISLPSALIRFRQGIGRLIRSSQDCGELVILDSRILRKSYGKDFINELPKRDFEVSSLSDRFEKSGFEFDQEGF